MPGTDPQSPAPQCPQPSYFSLRRTRSYLSGSPSESPATTPGSPADAESQLLTPGGRPNLFKSKLPVPQRFSKATKKGAAGPTRLQSKWLGRGGNPLSTDSLQSDPASDLQNALPFSSSSATASSPLASLRSSLSGSQSSGLSSVSSDGHHHHRRRASDESHHDGDDRHAVQSALRSSTDEIEEVARSIHDKEHLRPTVIVRDYGTSDEGRFPAKFDPLLRLDPLQRTNSGKWADRLRQRPSQLSLSRPTSPSPDLLSPAAVYLRSPLAVKSTSNIEDTLSRSFLRTNSRPKAGKHVDEDIDFNRIKLPAPLAPSLSLPELRSPFEDRSELIDDRDLVDRFRPKRPHRGLPRVSRDNSAGSSFSLSTGDDDDSEEEDDGLGPPPDVPPALEYVDPEIECIAPNASTTTLPLAEAQRLDEPGNQHPWSTPPFNIVERSTPTIRKWRATFKVSISFAVVSSLLVGYGLRVKIVKVGPWSFGMYGLLLVVDFIVQTIAASVNRRRVNALTKKSPLVKGVAERLAAQDETPAVEPAPLPECSIAVVGYREDEEAWIACLKSLQAQEYPIKHIIGVVDGNDGPDLAMADAFGKAFPEDQRLISHLPVLLSVMYKEKYWEYINSLDHPQLSRWQFFKMWLTQKARPGQAEAHEVAWNHILNYLHAKATEERWADWKGICFSQPHGHKRHAMFTAFMVGAYALGTKDAMLTTDSDTYVYPDAVKNMMALLFSDSRLAGVTGDVRIWNKSDSFLALMSSIRYWFAFNVERACQSAFGCVGCLSGPLGLYKTSDLISVLGPWILQSFLGKETTFGDDRHLSNRILSLGHKTGYTHLAMCDSDTPAGYVRWVKQQTRWSKSFFREAYWFPKSFAYHDFWLTVETTKQFMYPMVLTATVTHMLYQPTSWIRPLIWLATMFGVAVIKSIYGVICLKDPRQFLFGIYGFMYFFGLLPSKLFACFTVHITNWGTSARSKSEFARPESFLSRTTHVGHLVVWYMMLSVGLGYLLATVFHQPFFWLVGVLGLLLSSQVYADVIVGETKYAVYMLKKKWRARRATQVTDLEKGATKTKRSPFKKLRRGKRSQKAAVEADLPLEEIPEVIPPALVAVDESVDGSVDSEDARVALPMPPAISALESSSIPSRQETSSSTQSQPAILVTGPSGRPAIDFADGRKGSVSSGSTGSDENAPYTPDVALAAEPVLSYLPLADTLLKALTGARPAEKQKASASTSGDRLQQEKQDLVIEEVPRSSGAMVL